MPTNSKYYSASNNQLYSLLGAPPNFPGSSLFTFLAKNTFLVAISAIVAMAAVASIAEAAAADWLAVLIFATIINN